MPASIRLPPQPSACELCARAAPLTRHHLIPKTLHDKPYVQKHYSREQRITATLWVCRACHNQIHRLFSEKDLGSVPVSFAAAPEPVLARGKARDAKFSRLNELSRNAASR
ncbi:hypothetical protein [Pseudomonas sp. 21C1]|uniref:hypothetical protein n=1 Tax=Pseudomonas sp. 21C1 TaxID=1843690 RepID=UPI0009F6BC94|nr:hypothetical protein [Pseudomonas sp. 21C1]